MKKWKLQIIVNFIVLIHTWKMLLCLIMRKNSCQQPEPTKKSINALLKDLASTYNCHFDVAWLYLHLTSERMKQKMRKLLVFGASLRKGYRENFEPKYTWEKSRDQMARCRTFLVDSIINGKFHTRFIRKHAWYFVY